MKYNYKTYLVSLLFCAFFLEANAQQKQMSGKVTDTSLMPIPGVNVRVKHQNKGITTNFEGEFSLNISTKDTLVFSYMGYQPQEIAVSKQNFLAIQLAPAAHALQEVVINAGYYSTTERERTGNIVRVSGKDIELQPLVSPLQALQGRMAGVEMNTNSATPGAAPTIRIRGQNSLRQEGNSPLYIIDGVPINSTPIESNSSLGFAGIDPLSTLNLSNIESIEVLKDADATAIYGSRGANGVILITTKKGKDQKGIQARIYSGVASVPNKLDLLTTKEYLRLRQQAFTNDGVEPNETNAYDLLLWDQDRYTDWQEEFLGGTAAITDVNIAAQGGNDQTYFSVNGAFHQQGSIYPVDLQYQKFTGGFNLDHHAKDNKFQLNLAINYGVDENELLGDGINFGLKAFQLPPNAPELYLDDGSLNWEAWSEAGLTNPLEGIFNSSTTQARNLITNLNLSYVLVDGLELKTNLGFTDYRSDELVKMPKRSYNPAGTPLHTSLTTESQRKSWIIEPQLHYTKQWGKVNLQALVGGTFQENQYDTFSVQGNKYISEALIGNLGAAESLINARARNTDYRYEAVFSRLGLHWDKKYYLNLTGRRDGSSRFAEGNRFANFGAIGAAWIFTEEAFFKDRLHWVSFGKLRGSYGTTGNDQIPDYGYLDAYEATMGPGGVYPTGLANPNYSWEVNKKAEAGVQLGFVKSRIDVGVSVYRNRSSNQLVGYPLPGITGFTSVQANLPATVENRGVELEFSSENIRREDFRWETSFNISFPKNELLRYPGLEESPYADRYRVGHPLNIGLLYAYQGIDEATGYYQVKDQNGDEVYDQEDRQVIFDRSRAYFGGLNNSFRYKGFSLQFLFQFVKQKGSFTGLFNTGFPQNQLDEVRDDSSPYTQVSQTPEASQAYARATESDLVSEDASFIRLKTLNLSYSLPTHWLESLSLSEVTFFMTGQNLLTITPYKGMDPAIPNGGTAFSGLRTLTTGVQLNF
ncbi:SusC/RagA family TonB-linked outer membrane protein [Mesonia aestuariivivens]|uniref:SusC/RagA family TonB-linked outer membrane protein n=1 Tax=Mesonia aestuariivivens TaxID=2796128 RepID=A0ABS6W5C6_9FLAO|nr:SusC/RagA family TonB-linked outer membrane protein [Mesonia aestuariivivens]MBW2962914.1 SusC/RagA family TonB-linked outer membrane protein [Mesonia aestuariivivens]